MSRPARRPEEDSADADLVRRVRAGERAAVDALYLRFGRPAYALARRILADDGMAEAVVRQVFVAVWRDPSAFDRASGSVASRLLALVHQQAVETVRREESQRRRRPRAEQVRPALGLLSSPQRELLGLAHDGGYTQREIAALTGAPLGIVRAQMLAAVRRLRAELGRPASGRPVDDAAVDGPAR